MYRHNTARATQFGALLVILYFAAAAAQAAAPAAPQPAAGPPDLCDRACLRQKLDSYLEAVFKHDPGAAGLSDNHFSTYNTAVVLKGQAFWKNIGGYGEVQRRYLDPVNRTAAYFGLLKEDDKDVITSVRIRVDGGKVSEAEWIIGRQGPGGRGESNPAGLAKYPPPPDSALPPAERSTRFILIALANNYFQGVVEHDGSWIPNDPSCIRIENGGGTLSTAPPTRGKCVDNWVNFKGTTADLALRRIPVVDEEAGMVLGIAIYRRNYGNPALHNLVHEYFLVRNGGKIAGAWTSMYFLPTGTPVTTGWEDR